MSIRSAVKRIVPKAILDPVRQKLWERRENRKAALAIDDWERRIGAQAAFAPIEPAEAVLIVPADQLTIYGSRGEDAMVTATIERAKARRPGIAVNIIANGEEAIAESQRRGYLTHALPDTIELVDAIDALLTKLRPRAVVVIGADVIDGHYGAYLACKLLIIADVAARHGIPAIVLGFSFNASPSPQVIRALDRLHPGVALKLRDPSSLKRFAQRTKAKPTLVADSAFMLVPDREAPAVREARSWIDARHAAGRTVIAFNSHPLFASLVTDSQIRDLIDVSAKALIDVAKQRKVSWLLLPHDHRGSMGDVVVLAPIFEATKAALGDDVWYLEGKHPATTLKGVATTVDGVVAGRMHLAIGALSSGVPTAGLTYQDKFEGLYELLALPGWLLVPMTRLTEEDRLRELLLQFIDNIDTVRQALAASLPRVRQMAETNLAELDAALDVGGSA